MLLVACRLSANGNQQQLHVGEAAVNQHLFTIPPSALLSILSSRSAVFSSLFALLSYLFPLPFSGHFLLLSSLYGKEAFLHHASLGFDPSSPVPLLSARFPLLFSLLSSVFSLLSSLLSLLSSLFSLLATLSPLFSLLSSVFSLLSSLF